MTLNLANILTITRLALLPPIILLFFIPAAWAAWACLILYVAGALTDILDGWAARRYNQISELGKFLDPISDKIFVITILLMLIATDRIEGIWVLPVVIILAREFLVAGLREFLGPKNVPLPVTHMAKWKTAIQMIATGVMIVAPYMHWTIEIAGLTGICAAAALTAITGWAYLKAGLSHIKE